MLLTVVGYLLAAMHTILGIFYVVDHAEKWTS